MLVICGIGAVSAVPTFAGKTPRMPSRYALPALAIIAMFVAYALSQPWAAYLILAGIYLATLPLSAIIYQKRKSAYLSQQGEN